MLSGRIALANRSIDGRESVVALMEHGDVFGEMPLFDGLGRSTAARALEPSEVIAIPYTPIQEVYEGRPTLLWGVVALLSGRLRSMDAALADSVFLDVTGRTAKRLLEVAGDDDEFVLPVTQEELAGMVGASRERVNKAIAAFVRLGWIEQSERRYRIWRGARRVRRVLGPMGRARESSCTKPWSAPSVDHDLGLPPRGSSSAMLGRAAPTGRPVPASNEHRARPRRAVSVMPSGCRPCVSLRPVRRARRIIP